MTIVLDNLDLIKIGIGYAYLGEWEKIDEEIVPVYRKSAKCDEKERKLLTDLVRDGNPDVADYGATLALEYIKKLNNPNEEEQKDLIEALECSAYERDPRTEIFARFRATLALIEASKKMKIDLTFHPLVYNLEEAAKSGQSELAKLYIEYIKEKRPNSYEEMKSWAMEVMDKL